MKRDCKITPSLKRAKKGYILHLKRFSKIYAQTSPWYVGDTLDAYITAHRKKRNYLLEQLIAKWAVDLRLEQQWIIRRGTNVAGAQQ